MFDFGFIATTELVGALLLTVAGSLLGYSLARTRHPPAILTGRSHRQRLQQLADMASGGVLICDGERIVACNVAMRGLLPRSGPVRGAALGHVLPGWTVAGIPGGREVETNLHTQVGPVAVRLSKRTVVHRDRTHTVVAVVDQRPRLQHEAELLRLRDTDLLTGLANRARLEAAVDGLYADRSGPVRFALLVIGLDRFNSVNDSFGQPAGDELLRRIAGQLRSMPGRISLAARLGGDEFALVLDEDDPAFIQALGDGLIEALTRWFRADSCAGNLGVSAGFAMAASDADDARALCLGAGMALRRAKADGKGVCRQFERAVADGLRRRHGLELALRRAVADRQLEVHFQPQVDLRTGEFDGAEALLRWRHPERGLVEPCDFLPVAEESGLIAEIGEWVLATACAAAAGLHDHLRVAVNLSALQFRKPDLAQAFARIMANVRFAPERLELEITESVLMRDEWQAVGTLTRLRDMGVRIALDDFGTGHSSLSYLRRFPFDKVKLDRSFVSRAPDDHADAAIVTAILTLGQSLGFATTAEGVETERQSAFVAARGCMQGQGFLLGRPVPGHALPAAFHRRLPGALA